MSVEHPTGYRIQYYAADELKSSDDHPGPLHRTERWAINGMTKYLFSGIDRARILDGSGKQVNEVRATPQSFGLS